MLQHLLVTHGDHFLQTIRNLSQGLNLSLDGEASLRTAMTRKVYSLPNQQKNNLTPAKFEAWKMWHEDGLSIQKIAVCLIWFSKNIALLTYKKNSYLPYICVSICCVVWLEFEESMDYTIFIMTYFFNHRTSRVDQLLSKNKLFHNTS